MLDYLPSIKDIIINLVMLALTSGGAYLLKRYGKFLYLTKIPSWITYGLAAYALITISIFLYNYYDLHKPLEVHKNEHISHETIILDGKSYENCTFDNVRLILRGRKTGKLFNTTGQNNEIYFEKRAAIGFYILGDMKRDKFFAPFANQFLLDMLNNRAADYSDPETTPIEDM